MISGDLIREVTALAKAQLTEKYSRAMAICDLQGLKRNSVVRHSLERSKVQYLVTVKSDDHDIHSIQCKFDAIKICKVIDYYPIKRFTM